MFRLILSYFEEFPHFCYRIYFLRMLSFGQRPKLALNKLCHIGFGVLTNHPNI